MSTAKKNISKQVRQGLSKTAKTVGKAINTPIGGLATTAALLAMPGVGTALMAALQANQLSQTVAASLNNRKADMSLSRQPPSRTSRPAQARIRGKGTYYVSGNPEETPRFSSDGQNVVADIEVLPQQVISQGNTGLYTIVVPLQPGLLVDKLAQEACNFGEYTQLGMCVDYKPVVTELSTSAPGRVCIVSTECSEPQFSTFPQAQMFEGAVSGSTTKMLRHYVESDDRQRAGAKVLLVRYGAVPEGQAISNYDAGELRVLITGVDATAYPAGTLLGEIYVSYRYKFFKSRLCASLGLRINCDKFWGSSSGWTTTIPFGTAPYKHVNNVIGGTLTKTATQRYVFPDYIHGHFRVLMYQLGSSSVSNVTSTLYGNITVNQDLTQGGLSNQEYLSGQTGTTNSQSMIIKDIIVSPAVISGGNYINFVSTGSASSGCYLEITQINPNLYLSGTPNAQGVLA